MNNNMNNKKIQKKWDVILNSSGFPKIIGSEPGWHRKQRERYHKLKEILGDDDFFDIISEKEYEDFINEKFLPPARTLAEDLVSVQPLSLPSNNLMYMEFVYGKTIEEKRLVKLKELLGLC